jgi:hypothetical protein
MSEHEQSLREAYLAGLDKLNHGANEKNCRFSLFNTKERTKAWEFGAAGLPFNYKSIVEGAV